MKKLQKTKLVLALGICVASGLLMSATRVHAAQTKHIAMMPTENLHSIKKNANGIVPPSNDGDGFCVHLTAADQGRTVLTMPGEKVIVDLQENRFAGYRWSVSNSDEQVASLENATFQTVRPEGRFISPYAEHTARSYTFVAHESGTTQLLFQYSHYDWHTQAPKVSQQFTVTIQVDEATLPSWPQSQSPAHPLSLTPSQLTLHA